MLDVRVADIAGDGAIDVTVEVGLLVKGQDGLFVSLGYGLGRHIEFQSGVLSTALAVRGQGGLALRSAGLVRPLSCRHLPDMRRAAVGTAMRCMESAVTTVPSGASDNGSAAYSTLGGICASNLFC